MFSPKTNALQTIAGSEETANTQMTGYKAALSVSVFHTMGNICCMEDTMGLGKFFTNAVTACETNKQRKQGFEPWKVATDKKKTKRLT